MSHSCWHRGLRRIFLTERRSRWATKPSKVGNLAVFAPHPQEVSPGRRVSRSPSTGPGSHPEKSIFFFDTEVLVPASPQPRHTPFAPTRGGRILGNVYRWLARRPLSDIIQTQSTGSPLREGNAPPDSEKSFGDFSVRPLTELSAIAIFVFLAGYSAYPVGYSWIEDAFSEVVVGRRIRPLSNWQRGCLPLVGVSRCSSLTIWLW